MTMGFLFPLWLLAAGAQTSTPSSAATTCDAAETAAWREYRETDYRRPDGWLSVAGLFFLEPGLNTLGSAPDAVVRLPEDVVPAKAGTVNLRGARVFVTLEPGVEATLGGKRVDGPVELRPAEEGRPADRLRIGRVTIQVHPSGDRLAIRLRDPKSPLFAAFEGFAWYPFDARWCVTGRFEAFPEPRRIPVLNTVGDLVDLESPGLVHVTLAGRKVQLLPVKSESGDRLWFIFTDRTAGQDTYKVRFLYAHLPSADGKVLLDFNRAYNPPCAINPHTTCPLPPKENRLAVRVEAGERLRKQETGSRK